MTSHSFYIGDTVVIINQTQGGRYIVEGKATVFEIMETDETYNVEWPDGDLSVRFVDPAAQSDPTAFVASLNAVAENEMQAKAC